MSSGVEIRIDLRRRDLEDVGHHRLKIGKLHKRPRKLSAEAMRKPPLLLRHHLKPCVGLATGVS